MQCRYAGLFCFVSTQLATKATGVAIAIEFTGQISSRTQEDWATAEAARQTRQSTIQRNTKQRNEPPCPIRLDLG